MRAQQDEGLNINTYINISTLPMLCRTGTILVPGQQCAAEGFPPINRTLPAGARNEGPFIQYSSKQSENCGPD